MTTKSTKSSLFLTLRGPSANRKDLQALILVGPTRDNWVLDPLAVLHLNNLAYILPRLHKFEVYSSIITVSQDMTIPFAKQTLDS